MQHLSRYRIVHGLVINVPLDENIALDRKILLEIMEQQALYESFLDSLAKYAGEVKDKVVTVISDYKDFAAVMYRVVKENAGKVFSQVLLRNFEASDIKKKIEEILDKIGKSDLLKTLIEKIKQITNPLVQLLSSVGITVAAKYLYDKFKTLDPTSENIKKQVLAFVGSYVSEEALKTAGSFVSGGITSLISWFQKAGIAAATIYKTLESTIAKFKDAFAKQDKGEKNAVMLVKEKPEALHEGEFCPQCLAEYILTHKNLTVEAEYKGRQVPLGKPMKGDVKKFKVYVKNKKGNVIKVEFGQPGVKIKKNNPKRRKSFRARHRCHTAKDRTTARYWSCRKW